MKWLTIPIAIGVLLAAQRSSPRIRFQDVTAGSGIRFVLQNGAVGRFSQPEIMTGGIAAFDYNNDGCIDIFVANGATLPDRDKSDKRFWNRLYRNNCDMTFTDVTERAGLAGYGYSMGAAAADFDNDGFEDLLVTGLRGNILYRNRGDGTFEDFTHKAGLDRIDTGYGPMWSVSAGWFDYDNDGFLDLFVADYVSWDPAREIGCKFNGAPVYCHPRDYKGLPNRLLHNNGDGTFADVSAASGIAGSIGKGMGVAFGDFNQDGLIDVFVANDSVPNFLFQNLGGGKFKEVAAEAGVAYNAKGNAVAGMGAVFQDFNNDGLDDIAIDAMYWDAFTLYRNHGRPDFFSDETMASGLVTATRDLTGWGMGMFDFDNDGWKDLFFAASHFPGTEQQVKAAPELPNRVLRNLRNGTFADENAFQDAALFHGAAFADFDNDGRIDAAVTAIGGSLRIYRNISPGANHWIALRLIGKRSNRDGLGARVALTQTDGARQYNRATTSVGYASSSEPLVRFGLGAVHRAAEVEIRWPDGTVQRISNPAPDRTLTVREK